MDSDPIVDPEASQEPPIETEEDLDEKYVLTSCQFHIKLTAEWNVRYPNRPHNHSPTLPFYELFLNLFNPLSEIKKKPPGPPAARRKAGPHGQSNANLNPLERRRDVIERFIDDGERKWATTYTLPFD